MQGVNFKEQEGTTVKFIGLEDEKRAKPRDGDFPELEMILLQTYSGTA